MEIYDNAAVALNGSLLAEATTVAVDWVSGDQIVNVLGGGSKRTLLVIPGARYVKIEFSLALPVLGPNVGLIDRYDAVESVTMQVFLAGNGQRLNSKGWLMSPQLQAAVASNATLQFTFVGEADIFR